MNLFNLNKTSAMLYEAAKNLPIYDYHCHLSPKEIAEDKPFENITDMLLGGDHYKWRAMRCAGVCEELITGNASKLDRFKAWASTFERLIGSPLYSWSLMEFKMFFGIDEVLSSKNAERIYNECNKVIAEKKLSPRKLIKQSKVNLICTTDDPDDNLEYHKAIAAAAAAAEDKSFDTLVLPTFRPDRILKNADGLSRAELLTHLEKRLDYFVQNGCKLSDHSIESFDGDMEIYAELGKMYADRDIVMQIHLGALRSPNSKMLKELGVDTGFDVMNDLITARPLAGLLDSMNEKGMPKVVLYSLNSNDNNFLSAIAGSFRNVQFGTAWWFNDNKDGMLDQLRYSANNGLLAHFIGMLTDSRSFLSYARHDYFRRILCCFIAELIDNDEFLSGEEITKDIIEGICYKNIVRYLGL